MNNTLLAYLKEQPEMVPEKHDGSYDLIKCLLEEYKSVPIDILDYSDMNVIYFMIVVTQKSTIDHKRRIINECHLSDESKKIVMGKLDEIADKADKGYYSNGKSIGMFGTGFMTFEGKVIDSQIQKFFELCIKLVDVTNEDQALNTAEDYLNSPIKNVRSGVVSIILHCINPFFFPIINSNEGKGTQVYSMLDIDLNKPVQSNTYIENVRKIRAFKDKNVTFKNYRIFNLADPYIAPVVVTEEQWDKMISEGIVIKQSDIDLFDKMMSLGAKSTCKQLSENFGGTPSGYISRFVSIAKRIQKHLNLPIQNREDGSKRYWNILFTGDYTEDKQYFEWTMREELKRALLKVQPSYNNKQYWWLVASPKIWSFSNIATGEEVSYDLINENGNKRKVYKNFIDAKEGDLVIGYEAHPVKSIVALCIISKSNDGKKIYFKKTEALSFPIELKTLKEIPELQNMEFLKILNGSFFKLSNNEYSLIMDIVREHNPIKPSFDFLKYDKKTFLSEVFMLEKTYDELNSLIKRKKNVILQGPPGVGKTYVAKKLAYSIMGKRDDSRISMIQFHQSYSYEDFIMGYRPDESGFSLKYGVFYNFCKTAENNPDKDHFFIIDEINRGNLSKIFGELLMLIECDKRGEKLALAYSDMLFSVPKNIFILGMMNTADRSLAILDYALRRRFSFYDIEPAFELNEFSNYLRRNHVNEDIIGKIVLKMKNLNHTIENDPNLGRGFRIGHSYFCDCNSIDDNWYQSIIKYEIMPLLSEYWFDDKNKVNDFERDLME